MASFTPTFDAAERLGAVADELLYAVTSTARQAHELAVGSHEAQRYPDRDTYAAAIRVNLHKMLVDKIKDIPGVVARKPENTRARFDLPFVQETNVVLHWWRYASDGHTRREDARIAVSALREHLMTAAPTAVDDQLTLEHAELSDEEIERQFEEEAHFNLEMAKSGRTVTLGIASSPDGLFDFGWGDADLADPATGRVIWTSWQSLKEIVVPPSSYPKPLVPIPAPAARFDDGAQDTPFDLSWRPPSTEVASSELETQPQRTGSADGE